jgi:hypothetical protein
MLQARTSAGFVSRWGHWMFTMSLMIPALVCAKAYSAPNIKETDKWFWWVECDWSVRITTLQTSVSRISRKCWLRDVSQPYGPQQPVTEITLLLCRWCSYLTGSMRLHGQLRGGLYLYLSYVCPEPTRVYVIPAGKLHTEFRSFEAGSECNIYYN